MAKRQEQPVRPVVDLAPLTLRQLADRADELGTDRVYLELERRRALGIPLDADRDGVTP